MVFMLPAEFEARQTDVDNVEEASARLVLSENRHLKLLYINGGAAVSRPEIH